MLSRANSVGWMGEREEGDSSLSWHHNPCNNVVVVDNSTTNDNNNIINNNDDVSFKSLLDVQNEWYNYNNNTITNTSNINVNHQNSINFSTTNVTNCSENLLINPIDSSSCTPSPSVFNSTQTPFFFPSKSNLFNNPLPQSFVLGNGFFPETQPHGGLVLGGGFTEFSPQNEMGSPNLVNNPHFSTAHLVQLNENEGFNTGFGSRFRGFDEGLGNSMFVNRGSKLLKPLDNSAPPVGAQPTLFQKRAALRKSVASGSEGENTNDIINNNKSVGKFNNSCGENDKKRKFGNMGILDNVSFDGSAFNYDSDDFTENHNFSEGANNGGANSNNNSTVTGGGGGDDCKGKKKGLPAKNLMAERRRRKKLNDRLYMLRSVVPKISKMDRASILGDEIEYLKELLQKINDLHNELESTPPPLTQTANFHPLTPTLPNLPSRIKEELCPSSLQSPNGQPARIEVRLREGRAVNIHMFCGRRPGLLLSTMRAIDGLGLDIQQAVISCFNGFAMDIFRAEQCKDGQDLHPEQIKALLLELATFPGSTVSSNCNI